MVEPLEKTACQVSVTASWDAEASVWFSQSDIPGLVVEAATLAEFWRLVGALAPELLAANAAEAAQLGP